MILHQGFAMIPVLAALSYAAPTTQPGKSWNTNEVYYQCFDWDLLSQPRSDFYNSLNTQIDDLKDAGIDGVWFPPPSQTADQQGYMPGEWYTIPGGDALKQVAQNVRNHSMKVSVGGEDEDFTC